MGQSTAFGLVHVGPRPYHITDPSTLGGIIFQNFTYQLPNPHDKVPVRWRRDYAHMMRGSVEALIKAESGGHVG